VLFATEKNVKILDFVIILVLIMKTDEIIRQFSNVYTGRQPSLITRASGRVELIGGHTDYNEGFVIATAIDSSYWVTAAPYDDNKVCMYSEWAGQKDEFALDDAIQTSDERKWANYGRGVAAVLLEEDFKLKGARLHISGNVPVGAGLSSSAALEVSIAQALLQIAGIDPKTIAPSKLAHICQKAENVYAKSPCGIMDQMMSITGLDDHAIFLDCRDISTKALPLDSRKCSIMILNSMVRHEVGGGEYGKRRSQCSAACKAIAKKYPQVKALRDADEKMLNSVKSELDEVTFKRAMHVIGEDNRVLAACSALNDNNIAAFGELMHKSHCSARDLYEISCPEIDFLVEEVCRQKGAFGARLSGGGFGGAAVALVKPEAVEAIRCHIEPAYKKRFGIDCQIHIAKPSKGIDVISL
jgi:galactokinase